MMLELTTREAQELGNALESYLSDLRMEIAGHGQLGLPADD